MPEAPFIGDVGDGAVRSHPSQIPAHTIETYGLEVLLGRDTETIEKSTVQGPITRTGCPADVLDGGGAVGLFLDIFQREPQRTGPKGWIWGSPLGFETCCECANKGGVDFELHFGASRLTERDVGMGRDHTLFALAAQTGLRVSELIGLRCADVHLGIGAHVSCLGKGRKQRITPITKGVVAVLRNWLAERAGQAAEPLFVTRSGNVLSRDALEHRLATHTASAACTCPSLYQKKITLHGLRHTAAMRLLHAGVDTSVIALWLGHEQIETTNIYLHADLAIKERALARTTPVHSTPGRYRPPDTLIAFLEAL